jgi:hypothetical protein
VESSYYQQLVVWGWNALSNPLVTAALGVILSFFINHVKERIKERKEKRIHHCNRFNEEVLNPWLKLKPILVPEIGLQQYPRSLIPLYVNILAVQCSNATVELFRTSRVSSGSGA